MRKRLFPNLRVRPRLAIACAIGILLHSLLPQDWRMVTKLLISWDGGVFIYLCLVVLMMYKSDNAMIRYRAAAQDEGSFFILGATVFSAVISVIAIMKELATAKEIGHLLFQHVILAGATVILSWLFMQTMFALHYAHAFYNRIASRTHGGLEFPGGLSNPDYWDFLYFSLIIGTAAQTADININSRTIRRIVSLHCVIVFFFNTTILALTINVGASLLS
ncbi:MAG: hypothetical protein N5P05_000328 [Chroococcopsis gigantea SAG 12.99]|jgi:uncharacterized membrane protein|nr:hypothetical protein [Chroococcopsis gigantea SAG 12.99]